ncbi:16S rRNA methyltransferase [Buchnera aphidicola (Cinara tujafilina)]|uniref:Ribosomal RNA small subunit methyltransferase E n=1 Tax=Buchnera aphidicola (Cinara tujafilina) TaxID=261317 RepID=F7WZU9_9GAMM|nr:16S rRNA (uracil(1498)-N(3))-methyltransferase [Buchnera aphidicola]AEH39849.1 16S rRNA methyltransferase [Buchnera aphidicola (Cinara tujafilina)]
MKNKKLNNTMFFPRIYCKNILEAKKIIILDKKKKYLIKVLRIKIGDIIIIFNNTNYIYYAKILNIQTKKIIVNIIKKQEENNESPIKIHLIQIISKKTKMNFTIEKSVELGVSSITPIISSYSKKNYLYKNIEKKINYWNNIIIAACSQSQRNIIPILCQPKKLNEWNKTVPHSEIKIYFHKHTHNKINIIQNRNIKDIYLIIGSEKGFSKNEMEYMDKKNFLPVSLGPRVLRTETAAIAAITSIQILFGDML